MPALRERLTLIVITDAALAAPRGVVDVVREALSAGAPAVQLRYKEMGAADLFALGAQLRALTRAAGALFFVNDRVDVALAVGADGAHLGPDDIPIGAVRAFVPDGFLLGASTDDPDEARTLAAAGADYIGCGTVYATRTKADAGAIVGPEGLDRVASAVEIPIVGIGGVTVERSAEIAATTAAAGVAVVSAVMAAPDPAAAVRGLLAPWSTRTQG